MAAAASPLGAQTPAPSIGEMKKLSLEELMGLEVTSVSRTEERLGEAAAAVAVVTNEDIRRSGATSLPEALRHVPGLHVARQTTTGWAVASRGFTSLNSEKLLVLSDTRSIYTPLFAGVLWDAQHHLMQDVERIEVVRGPGAALWGSNAVNGVISVTTRSARDTQGFFGQVRSGTNEHASVAARYGDRIGTDVHYRVFGRYFDRDATFNPGTTNEDGWTSGHAGFRLDWDLTESETLTLQGDSYRGTAGQLEPSIAVSGRDDPIGRLRTHLGGGNLLARWRRAYSRTSDLQVRAYYDRTSRDDPAFDDVLDTFDVDLQHRFSPATGHQVTWGSNYRFTSNRNDGKGVFALSPSSSRDSLFSGFVQDQFRPIGALQVTAGTKLEHNDFSGVEVQPSGRAAWDVSRTHVVWGAASRAVRVPTRLERDLAIEAMSPGIDGILLLSGNRDFDAERLMAYEAGHRWRPIATFSTDIAVFHNRYRGLASYEFGTPFLDAAGRTVIPLRNENLTSGHGSGLEALVTYSPFRMSRFTGTYSHLRMELEPQGLDLNRGALIEEATPRHQFSLRSSLDLPAGFQVDALYRHLSDIRRLPLSPSGAGVPGYAELNLRLAWIGWRQAEISLVAHDLLHRRHQEFGFRNVRSDIERGVYGSIAWGF